MDLKIIYPTITDDYIVEAHRFLLESKIKPQFSKALMKRFFTELNSTPQNIIEVWDGSKKIACAALVDKITNPHHSASVELLGFNNLDNPKEVLSLISNHFEKITKRREVHLAHMINFHDSLPFKVDAIKNLGYVPYFDTYDLISTQYLKIKNHDNPEYSISKLELKNFDEYYDVLCKSFADNPDTSIGPIDSMREHFKTNTLPIFITKFNTKIIGFITLLKYYDNGEINTLGVLPEFRKSGIGKNLLATGIDYLWGQKVSSVKLTVAVQNKKALDLYLNSGFIIQGSYLTLRKVL